MLRGHELFQAPASLPGASAEQPQMRGTPVECVSTDERGALKNRLNMTRKGQAGSGLQLGGHKLLHHLGILRAWSDGKEIPPVTFEFGPAGACNVRCIHCYIKHTGNRPVFMPLPMMKELFRSAARFGVKSCFIAGCGEPFLNRDLPEAVGFAREQGIDIGIATNGIPFGGREIEIFAPAASWIRFSVLSLDPDLFTRIQGAGPGSYRRLLENMEALCRFRENFHPDLTIGALVAVLPENIRDLFDTTARMKEIGLDYVMLRGVNDGEKTGYLPGGRFELEHIDDIRRFETLGDENFTAEARWDFFDPDSGKQFSGRPYGKCLGLPFTCHVDADGSVYACNGYWGVERFRYGSLLEAPFDTIWRSARRKRIVREVEAGIDFDECAKGATVCRLDNINRFLWTLKQKPAHVNFI